MKNFLILRTHDNIKPIPDFVACPVDYPGVPSACEWDQLLSEILQIIKNNNAFRILIELNLQKRQNFNSRRPSYGA